MLTATTPSADQIGTSNERTAPRAALRLRCEVRQGTRAWQQVVLEDLSPTGFRILRLVSPDPAKVLWIRIPGIQSLTANLCWTRGVATGCEFTAPLHIAVFEHLVRQAGGNLRA
ncbi:MAG: PilZ domain-containing protein [Sphingomonadaceae bacterium]|nr:PilZ domain-containing protein [Sphingomonadaceae bacterium]